MPAMEGLLTLPASCHFSPKPRPLPLASKVSRLSGVGEVFGDAITIGVVIIKDGGTATRLQSRIHSDVLVRGAKQIIGCLVLILDPLTDSLACPIPVSISHSPRGLFSVIHPACSCIKSFVQDEDRHFIIRLHSSKFTCTRKRGSAVTTEVLVVLGC